MKLLLSERGQIIAISNLIEYGVWGNVGNAKSWRIGTNSYIMDDNFSVIELEDIDIPTYVKEYEYYYINGEFKLADECPNEYKDKITELENQVIITEQAITDLDLQDIETQQMLTDMDIRLMMLEV